MAGTRRGTTKLRRKDRRRAVHRERVATAPTGEQQLALAFNHLRAVIYRHPRRADLLHTYATEIEATTRKLEDEL